MPDPDVPDPVVVSLWETRPRGHYTVAFEWTDDSGPVAGYLVLTSPRDGHRIEAALSWAQLDAVHRTTARRLAERVSNAVTGELPRITPGR